MHTDIKFINLTNDLAFKYVFSHEKLLIDLINSYFEIQREDKKVNKIVLTPESVIIAKRKKLKDYYGDIVVITDKNEILSIEMYSSFSKLAFNKSSVYMARLYSNQLKKNESYKNVHKVISLNFMTGNYNKITKYLINNYSFTNINTLVPVIDNIMEFVLIRLDLSNRNMYHESNKRFIRWLKLINAKSLEEMKNIGNGDEIMEETVKYLEEFLSEEAETFDREAYLKEVYTYDGEQAGLKKGKSNGLLEVAKNMLSMNLDINTISKATGLSIKKINKLKEEI